MNTKPLKGTRLGEELEKHLPTFKALDKYKTPCVVRRKVIYKGKMAKPGTLFLEMRLKVNNGTAVIVRNINGNLGEDVENYVKTEMRAQLFDKYKI
jgi:hypothetical protein